MELECEPEKEFQDVILLSCYTEDKPGDEEICLICHDANNTYDQYELTCRHRYHTRCYRRYCFYKDAIKCPLCDDIKPYKKKLKEIIPFIIDKKTKQFYKSLI